MSFYDLNSIGLDKRIGLWSAKGPQKVIQPYFCRNRVLIEMRIFLGISYLSVIAFIMKSHLHMLDV